MLLSLTDGLKAETQSSDYLRCKQAQESHAGANIALVAAHDGLSTFSENDLYVRDARKN